MEEPVEVDCPFCGECFTTFVDVSAGNQSYIEDCQVCCRPIMMTIAVRNGAVANVQCGRT